MAPQLSEATKRLFRTILKQEKEPKHEPKTEIRTTKMVGPSNPEKMDTREDQAPRPTKLNLKQPALFGGKRDKLEDFIQDILLYLGVNDGIYDSDKKKIGYTLTFMDKGDAKSWKSAFLQNATTTTGLNLGTWDAFLAKLKEDLKMGNNSIEDHIA